MTVRRDIAWHSILPIHRSLRKKRMLYFKALWIFAEDDVSFIEYIQEFVFTKMGMFINC